MNAPVPRTIDEYLKQLRAALRGADPAMIQDALYDAEEHLRAELAERADGDEAAMLADVVGSYGAPEEVAEIYRDQEVTVQRALRTPKTPPRRGPIGRFFGVAADPHTYGALFYMLLAMATGIFYFTWVVTGVSLSAGFSILIIGIPFLVLFIGTVRALSLLEGRIVETMLGVRMPRRPAYADRSLPWLKRIGAMFTDPRTWSTLLYMLLMLPLGIVYFIIVVTGISLSVSLACAPWAAFFISQNAIDTVYVNGQVWPPHDWYWWVVPLISIVGVLLLFVVLHLARAVGRMHGHLAKHLLVRGREAAQG
ncbi:sensor domain-containing protein [Oleiagrimonas soli]|uniref:Membrane protein n=1 Tax=Oleiagrimonas soli TaxID=1543381 RepID=A0A099CXA6_9GAMM|nr:sensor domain-containing protein [Oleiagrimonas soli]KGI77640.1 membrane protein [Oleiagrimonas soli]MBB6182859.1 putative membrane protein [Oleiagrimonas soli]